MLASVLTKFRISLTDYNRDSDCDLLVANVTVFGDGETKFYNYGNDFQICPPFFLFFFFNYHCISRETLGGGENWCTHMHVWANEKESD